MMRFNLVRTEDVTGISGTGIVAQGVRFDSLRCVMEWRGKVNSIAVYQSIEDLIAIHGHEGKTHVEWCRDFSVGDFVVANLKDGLNAGLCFRGTVTEQIIDTDHLRQWQVMSTDGKTYNCYDAELEIDPKGDA